MRAWLLTLLVVCAGGALAQDELGRAAGAGEVAAVTRLLAAPHRWDSLAAALNAAAGGGHVAVIRLLLDSGADVDAVCAGQTALQTAVAAVWLPAAKLLFERGASLGPVAAGDDGALHMLVIACANYTVERQDDVLPTIDWLLANGANVNQRGARGATALHHAARSWATETVKHLLARGAQVNALDDRGETPLDWAAERPYDTLAEEPIIKLLRAHGAGGGPRIAAGLRDLAMLRDWLARTGPGAFAVPPSDWSEQNDYQLPERYDAPEPVNALSAALRADWYAGASLLLQHGARLLPADGDTLRPLDLAVACDDIDLVRLLLRYGDQPGRLRVLDVPPAIDRLLRGWKPLPTLFEPAGAGDLAEVERRVAAGANLHLRDRYGMAALHHAAEHGRLTVAVWLLDRGALIDARDADWRTPLFAAAEAGHLPLVRMLLRRGAQVGLRDYHGDTALDAARRADFADIVAVLGAETAHGQ